MRNGISDREMEVAVVACMMLRPELDDPRLTTSTFTGADTSKVFSTILSMREEQGLVSDTLAVARALDTRGWLAEIGGASALEQFIATPGDLSSYGYYVSELLKAQTRRETALALEKLSREATAPDCSLGELSSKLDDLRSQIVGSQDSGIITAGDLLERYDVLPDPLIYGPGDGEGLIRAGESMSLNACTKGQKSWSAAQLAVCAATSQRWLGTFVVNECPVLWVDGELRKAVLSHRLKTVCDAMAVPVEWVADRIHVRAVRGERTNILTLLSQARRMRPKPGLLIVDPIYKLYPDGVDENSNGDIAKVYSAIDELAEHLGCGVCIVHHQSKGDQSGKRIVDIGSGAGAAARAVDAHVVLREHEQEDCAVLDCAVRSFRKPPPTVLRWTFPLWVPDHELDPAALKRPGKPHQDAQDREGLEAVINAITSGKRTKRAIRDSLTMGDGRVSRLLSMGEKAGRIKVAETIEWRGLQVEHWSPV